MPSYAKAIIASVLLVLMLASMGMVWVDDSSQRPEYCANCHNEPYYVSWDSSESLAHDHAQTAISCQRCHQRTLTDTLDELVVYSQDGYRASSIVKRYDIQLCTDCHGTYEEVAVRTQDYVINGEVHNPHNPHPDVPAGEIDPASTACYRCHMVHDESPAVEYCFSCHHTRELIGCNGSGCHEETETVPVGGGF